MKIRYFVLGIGMILIFILSIIVVSGEGCYGNFELYTGMDNPIKLKHTGICLTTIPNLNTFKWISDCSCVEGKFKFQDNVCDYDFLTYPGGDAGITDQGVAYKNLVRNKEKCNKCQGNKIRRCSDIEISNNCRLYYQCPGGCYQCQEIQGRTHCTLHKESAENIEVDGRSQFFANIHTYNPCKPPKCDLNDDGELKSSEDSFDYLCDTNGDGEKDSCYVCDTNDNTYVDSCCCGSGKINKKESLTFECKDNLEKKVKELKDIVEKEAHLKEFSQCTYPPDFSCNKAECLVAFFPPKINVALYPLGENRLEHKINEGNFVITDFPIGQIRDLLSHNEEKKYKAGKKVGDRIINKALKKLKKIMKKLNCKKCQNKKFTLVMTNVGKRSSNIRIPWIDIAVPELYAKFHYIIECKSDKIKEYKMEVELSAEKMCVD